MTPEALAADPDNRLLSRGPRHRAAAEVVRDQVLAASGLLSQKLHGPPARPFQPAFDLRAAFGGALDIFGECHAGTPKVTGVFSRRMRPPDSSMATVLIAAGSTSMRLQQSALRPSMCRRVARIGSAWLTKTN